LKEYPVAPGLGGILAVAFSLIVTLHDGGESWWLVLLAGAIGVTMVLVASVLTVSKDIGRAVLVLDHRSLLRRSTREIPLKEVTGVNLTSSRTSKGGRTYEVELVLRSGERVGLRGQSFAGRAGRERQAERLRTALGVGGPPRAPATTSWQGAEPAPRGAGIPSDRPRAGVTAGVSWQIDDLAFGGAPITRWRSSEFGFRGNFLLLVHEPRARGSSSTGWGADLVGFASSMLFPRLLGLYGFTGADTPGLDAAGPVEPADPHLERCFVTRTSDPAAARSLLNPRAVRALLDWVERHPPDGSEATSALTSAQLVVLFSPAAVYVATFRAPTAGHVEEVCALGAELVRAQHSG